MTISLHRSSTARARVLLVLALVGCAAGRVPGSSAEARAQWAPFYVGTYTDAGSRGIYRCRLDTRSGALDEPVLASESGNPSFLALHPNGRILYAANELQSYAGQRSGSLSAFAIDSAAGSLRLLGQQPSGGADPCFIAVDHAGRNILVANYTGGSVAVLPLAGDGRLLPASTLLQLTGSGPNAKRQEGPHAHQAVLDPGERFALVADLGSDRLRVYRYDPARGALDPNDPPAAVLAPGSGPRHLAWHPSGRHTYVISELASTVTVLRWNSERGALDALQTVTTLPAGFGGTNTAAEIALSADGRHLYASNRGDDSLAVFAVDPQDGTLASVARVPTGGRTPRHFAIDPTGRWLLVAHQGSDTIAVFRLDPASGIPAATGRAVALSRPVFVLFAGPG
jgi:6-phosphogluconolactonase